MSPYLTSILLIAFALGTLGVMAFLGAWMAARYLDRRMAAKRGSAWGGRGRERYRSKYFAKEQRARAARARHRQTLPPEPDEPPPAEPPPTGSPEARYRAVLGLDGEPLTEETLRKAFKQRVREYHPDRVAGLGAKLRALAEEETKRINEAYRQLRDRL